VIKDMPTFRSEKGEWFPTDKAAKEELAAKGIKTMGVRVKTEGQATMTTPNFPQVAKGQWDGVQMAPRRGPGRPKKGE